MTASTPDLRTAPPSDHPCYAMLAARTPASVIDFHHEAIGEAHRIDLGESLWLALYLLDGKVPLVLDKGVIGFQYRHGIAARDLGVTVKTIRQWMGVLVKTGYVAFMRPVTVNGVFWELTLTLDGSAFARDIQGGHNPCGTGLAPAGASG
jgi:hypothetical protein